MTPREELNLIVGGITHRKSALAALNERLETLVDKDFDAKLDDLKDRAFGTQATNRAIWTLIELFSEAVRSADAASLVNLRLQRRLWWLTIAAVVLAAFAAFGTFAQVYYARHADLRAIQLPAIQSQSGLQPMNPAPSVP